MWRKWYIDENIHQKGGNKLNIYNVEMIQMKKWKVYWMSRFTKKQTYQHKGALKITVKDGKGTLGCDK